MSIKDLYVKQNSSSKIDEGKIVKSNRCEPKICRNQTHKVTVFDALQSLREDEVLCDIRLKSDDDTIVFAHKVILVSATPYFRAMFTNFDESNKDIVDIREIDSTVLQMLVDYIYTGEILVTEQNVQVLLPAANLLQLDYVKDTCLEFLQTQLDPTNCLGIRAFAELHNCLELFSSSEAYIKKQFLDVVKYDEFLSLSSEQVIELISSNILNVPSEEKLCKLKCILVYECVINWAKHELDDRFDSLPKVMEHVRLPLLSMEYISIKVVDEPLLKNCPKLKDDIIEVFKLHSLKKKQLITIPLTIRNTPRQSGQKVILVFTLSNEAHWYDSSTNVWQRLPEISPPSDNIATVVVVKEHLVYVIRSFDETKSIELLDLSLKSLQWVSSLDDMLNKRKFFGVGVIDDCLYAVGGLTEIDEFLNNVEVFDTNNYEWRMVSSMSTNRCGLGVGVLNNLLYAVGGLNASSDLKSVECYDPSLDTWTPVSEMSVCRYGLGVGVLDGIMYDVGGMCIKELHKSVEAYDPSVRVWSSIADMNLHRSCPEVFALDGLLYVMGGLCSQNTYLNSVEIYNPNTNTWSMETLPTSMERITGGVVVNKSPPFLTTYK